MGTHDKRTARGRSHLLIASVSLLMSAMVQPVASGGARSADGAIAVTAAADALIAAYPDHLAGHENGDLVWRDGTRMPIDDQTGAKSQAAWEDRPDLKDMLRHSYVRGTAVEPPMLRVDPGRARNRAFFDKMYGTCTSTRSPPEMTTIDWLPRKSAQKVRVTTVNGVDRRLAAISAALDALPDEFDVYLKPSEGTYNCRVIAGTSRRSAHSYGIAIDLATARSDYWIWAKAPADGRTPYRNRMPMEIVDIFEAHGFIWGGKWYHYDTMHFEYRPELLPPSIALPTIEATGPQRR